MFHHRTIASFIFGRAALVGMMLIWPAGASAQSAPTKPDKEPPQKGQQPNEPQPNEPPNEKGAPQGTPKSTKLDSGQQLELDKEQGQKKLAAVRQLEAAKARLQAEQEQLLVQEALMRLVEKQSIPRFLFTIEPQTPLKDLLPAAPTGGTTGRPWIDDLRQVPEVRFRDPLARTLEVQKAREQTAHELAKMRFLNDRQLDGFLVALLDSRADLRGLPFAMGDACRTPGDQGRLFGEVAARVHECMRQALNDKSVVEGDRFWAAVADVPKALESKFKACQPEHLAVARVRALMQILGPETPALRKGLALHLATIPHAEATRALAQLALFSEEEEVRLVAIAGLKTRRERDYGDTLLAGFRYPLPAVARRAADALVRLEPADLVPQLVDLLDEADPRLPVSREVNRQKEQVVRELVRVNHHHNCMLCHSPDNPDDASVTAVLLTAPVPVPSEPLQGAAEGYGRSNRSPDVVVRIDVTYLRQDFSILQPVPDAAPWPEMQRFDYLVRTRVVSDQEAEDIRRAAPKTQAGSVTPYQRAVLFALRELTGRDTAPTPQAWRELLKLPAR